MFKKLKLSIKALKIVYQLSHKYFYCMFFNSFLGSIINFLNSAFTGIIAFLVSVNLSLKYLICILFLLAFVYFFLNALKGYVTDWVSQKYNTEFITRIFNKIFLSIQKIEIEEYEKNEIYNDITEVVQQSEMRTTALLVTLSDFITSFVSGLLIISMILFINPKILFIVSLDILITIFVFLKDSDLKYSTYVGKLPYERFKYFSKDFFQDRSNAQLIKIFPYFGNYIRNRFTECAKNELLLQKRYAKKYLRWFYLQIFVSEIFRVLIITILIKEMSKSNLNVAYLVTFISILYQSKYTILNIVLIIPQLYEHGMYFNKVIKFVDKKYNLNNDFRSNSTSIKSFVLKKISFAYSSNSKYILEDIDFECKKGDVVSIIGKNGSGKSTLLKIILGFYSPTGGIININEKKYSYIDFLNYRANMSVVFQNQLIYPFSIARNISPTGISNQKDCDRCAFLLDFFELSDKILSLPDGIDTAYSVEFENGSFLSGGEIQKINLVRAFFKDCDVYVLDEPTNMLDEYSKELLKKYITEYLNDKIVILVTHDSDLILHSNKVYEITNKKIYRRRVENESLF